MISITWKLINDSLGHLAGDQLIRSFAFLLKESMPATAKLYRYGGDEFAVFLPDADNGILERALRELEDRKEAYNMANTTRLSFAAGHAFFKKGQDHTLSDLIKRADSRLTPQAGHETVALNLRGDTYDGKSHGAA